MSLLSKNYPKFAAAAKKEFFKFLKQLMQHLCGKNANNLDVEQFYFPFNFDKHHWVGLCVEFTSSVVFVLDCNTSLRSDGALTKELNPFAQLLPFMLKQAGHKQQQMR